MPEILQNAFNLLLIVVGFGLVITVHELGHFLAAKWAKVRVLAFAVGFGQALVSYRKGMGWRRGTSEPLYKALPEDKKALVSPTEYRLNWMPIGGYVKMLGQEDADPTAVSDEPDSFQQVAVGKRMVIISAGVFLNLVLAAILFIIVFLVGMREPAAIVGDVRAGSPASSAGILPGDRIVSVNGTPPLGFSDLAIAAAMTGRGESMAIDIKRGDDELAFEVMPEVGPNGPKVLQLGVAPESSLEFFADPKDARLMELARRIKAGVGLQGIELEGRTILAIDGEPIEPVEIAPGQSARAYSTLKAIASRNPGATASLVIGAIEEDGPAPVTIRAPLTHDLPRMPVAVATTSGKPATLGVANALGLTPLVRVDPASIPDAKPEGLLMPGDTFIAMSIEGHPNTAMLVSQIRTVDNPTIHMLVDRNGERLQFSLNVRADGTVGFSLDESDLPILAATPQFLDADGEPVTTAAHRATPPIPAGLRVLSVGETAVTTFDDIVRAMRDQTTPHQPATITLIGTRTGESYPTVLELTADETAQLHAIPKHIPNLTRLLNTLEKTTQASGPIDAIGMGLQRTKRALLNTYITFRRLIEGTVPVDQLQGPVGITHTGTILANRGLIYVLFFFALINVNLAVVNFLPLPIVDGGQFVMLLYEKLTGRPIPIALQQGIMMIGLVMIAGFFLFVTFNDIKRLLGL